MMRKMLVSTMMLALSGCMAPAAEGELDEETLEEGADEDLESMVEALEQPTPDNPNPNVPHPVGAPVNLRIADKAYDHITISYECERGGLYTDMLRRDPGSNIYRGILTASAFNVCGPSMIDASTWPETRYCYKMRTRWNTGSATSTAVCDTTPKPPRAPEPPTLRIAGQTMTSVDLRYTDASHFETSFRVYRKRTDGTQWTLLKTQLRYDGDTAGTVGDPVRVHWPKGGELRVDDNGLTPDIHYDYRVDAVYEPLDGSAPLVSSSAVVTALTETYAPATPTDFRAEAIDKRHIHLDWEHADYDRTYEIHYERDHNGSSVTTGTINAGEDTEYTFEGLSGYRYCFKVRAKNRSGTSAWSERQCEYLESNPPPPPAGYRELAVFNCSDNESTIYLWLLNHTTGLYEEQTSLAPQWSSGGCPGNNQPERISLSDDTIYNFIAVDPTLGGCDGNNPGNPLCQRRITGNIRGDSDGAVLPQTVD